MGRPSLKLAAMLASFVAHTSWAGDFSLSADSAPSDPPWEKPASLSWVSEDGKTSASVDAVLKYKVQAPASAKPNFATEHHFTVGAYWHRNTKRDDEANDRGGQAAYTQTFFPGPGDTGASGAVTGLNWTAKLQVGKTLKIKKDDAGNEVSRGDKDTDRETVFLNGYYQFALGEFVPGRQKPVQFVDYSGGLYSDRAHGLGTGNGRLSGAKLGITYNVAPLGIDPESNKVGGLGVVPTLHAGAQVERDLAQSGDRTKDTYRLYTAGLTLFFGKVVKAYSGIVPSLSLERSTGADLLTGRAKSGKTELTLGVAF